MRLSQRGGERDEKCIFGKENPTGKDAGGGSLSLPLGVRRDAERRSKMKCRRSKLLIFPAQGRFWPGSTMPFLIEGYDEFVARDKVTFLRCQETTGMKAKVFILPGWPTHTFHINESMINKNDMSELVTDPVIGQEKTDQSGRQRLREYMPYYWWYKVKH